MELWISVRAWNNTKAREIQVVLWASSATNLCPRMTLRHAWHTSALFTFTARTKIHSELRENTVSSFPLSNGNKHSPAWTLCKGLVTEHKVIPLQGQERSSANQTSIFVFTDQETLTAETGSEWAGNVLRHFPVFTSHILTLSSNCRGNRGTRGFSQAPDWGIQPQPGYSMKSYSSWGRKPRTQPTLWEHLPEFLVSI